MPQSNKSTHRAIARSLGASLAIASTAVPIAAQTHWSESVHFAARRNHGIAYDQTRGRLVLLGGNISTGSARTQTLNDTAEFAAGRWQRRLPTLAPSVSPTAKLAHATSPRQTLALVFSPAEIAELWRYEGRTWARFNTANTPTARDFHALAYDESRNRLVLVGGSNPSGGINDVWEFDGTNWLQITASGPVPRNDAALCYDPIRRRILMHGGRSVGGAQTPLADTWEWDGSNWSQLNPSVAPPARAGHTMVFDPLRNRVVMFGGGTGTPGTLFDDTYTWDGSNWTLLTPASRPAARTLHAMAFDASSGRVVIHGGETTSGVRADTWAFDGSSWTSIGVDVSPDGRADHGAAFDERNGNLVLFGGRDRQQQELGDTWVHRDFTWTRLTPSTSPSPRSDLAMVWDPNAGRILLFGGRVNTQPNGETWLFDGTTWTQASPSSSPPARHSHALAFDRSRNRVVLFGGVATSALADTWEWDGSTWSQVNPTTSPPARSEHTLVFDPVSQRTLVAAGISTSSQFLQDTWLYDGTTWTQQVTGNLPSARSESVAAVDPRTNRVLLFGGAAGSAVRGDTLQWSGTNWVSQVLFPAPLGRHSHSMVADARRQHLVMFGGENPLGVRQETWVLSTTTIGFLRSLPATGCPGAGVGTAAAVEGFGRPFVGNGAFGFELYFGGRVTTPSFAVALLATRQGNASLPGCPIVPDPNALLAAAPALFTGPYQFTPCPIPNLLPLLGTELFGQVAHYQPPTPLDGLALSAGFRLVIGDL